MIIAILTGALVGVASVRTWRYFALDKYLPSPGIGVLFALIVSAAIVGAGFGASAIVTANTVNRTRVLTEVRHLRALNTGTDTSGTVFLLGGYFESGPSYTYLAERTDGGFEMTATSTDSAIVYQTDEPEPYVVTGQMRPTSTLWSLLPLPAPAEFYVPVGSVQDPSYRVDVNR